MSRNGSGTYSLPAGNPVVTGTTISSSWANTTLSDIASALTGSVASDGQTPMTGNLQMGSNKITGLAVATATGDALSYNQAATVTTLTTTGNVTIGGTLTLTGGLTLNGNVTVGDSSSDTLTVNATSTFAAGATFSSTFAANGGTTLGDASGDALTINSSAVSIPNGLNFDSNTFVIDATNNRVGVGTASPARILTVSESAPVFSLLSTSTSNTCQFAFGDPDDDNSGRINYDNSNDSMAFWTGAAERMRITSAGNVGIGTSSPSGILHLSTSTGTQLYAQNTGTAYSWARIENANSRLYVGIDGNTPSLDTANAPSIWGYSNYPMIFGVNNAKVMTLSTSGNLGLGVTPSASWSIGGNIQTVDGRYISSSGAYLNFATNAYYNAGSLYYISSVAAARYEQSAGSHRWYNAPSGTAGNAITFTQAMTLDASGNLGLGTSSPTSPAGQTRFVQTGNTAANGYVATQTTNSVTYEAYAGSTAVYVQSSTNHPLVFGTSNTERMRIDSSGNLLVGTTNSSDTSSTGARLLASGSIKSTLSASTNAGSTLDVYSTGAGLYRFYIGMAGTVFATSTTISAISDVRLKENIKDIDVGLDAVMALKPRKFDWKAGKGKNIKGDRGWIAQEFEQVFPEMINEWKDKAPEGEEPYKSVAADLIPVLVRAIQELKATVDAQAARIAVLESK
jgi:hypothetical protein